MGNSNSLARFFGTCSGRAAVSTGGCDADNAVRIVVAVYPPIKYISVFLLYLLRHIIELVLSASLSFSLYACAKDFTLTYINYSGG